MPESEVWNEAKSTEKPLLGAAALLLLSVMEIFRARAAQRRVVVICLHVMAFTDQLGRQLTEVDADRKSGLLKGVIEVTAVNEYANAVHDK